MINFQQCSYGYSDLYQFHLEKAKILVCNFKFLFKIIHSLSLKDLWNFPTIHIKYHKSYTVSPCNQFQRYADLFSFIISRLPRRLIFENQQSKRDNIRLIVSSNFTWTTKLEITFFQFFFGSNGKSLNIWKNNNIAKSFVPTLRETI